MSANVPYSLASHRCHISIYLEDPDGFHFEPFVKFKSREEAQAETANRGIESYRNPAGAV